MPRRKIKELTKINYNSLILKRAQREEFLGLAPTMDQIRSATKTRGIKWQGNKRVKGALDILQYSKMGRVGAIPLNIFQRVGMREAYGKANVNQFLNWAAANDKFSAQARESFKWAAEHTVPTYNLGYVYDKYGLKGGRKFLEKEFGQTHDKWWFRHQVSARSQAVWSPEAMSKLSPRERMAFFNRNQRAIYPKTTEGVLGLEVKISEAERRGKKLRTGLTKRDVKKGIATAGEVRKDQILGQNLKARMFQKDIAVSKGMNFSHEYRVVYAGGEAVDITHRWASPKVKAMFDKHPFMKKAFRGMGIESGYPELMQPVSKYESQVLKEFTRKLTPSFTQASGAFDIGRMAGKKLNVDSLRMIEQQISYGNLVQPWVRSRVESRLLGRAPLGKTVAKGAMIAGGIAAAAFIIPKIYNKIVGHHPGMVNKKTEAAIDSDFTAGRSRTRKGAKKESIPWVRHSLLASAAFMTALDRTKTLKGGLVGAGLAAGFIGLRHMLTPRSEEWKGLGKSVWNAVEFSAITSLLGSSMMKGGFLHKSVGVPAQNWINTRGYKHAVGFMSKVYSPETIKKMAQGRPVKGFGAKMAREALMADAAGESLLGAAARMNSVEEFATYMKDIAIQARSGKLSQAIGPEAFPRFLTRGMRKKLAGFVQNANEGVISKYYGETYNFLKGVAGGPRGPFEVTTGLGEFAQRILGITEATQKESYNAMMHILAPKGGIRNIYAKPLSYFGSKMVGKPMLDEAFYPLKNVTVDVMGGKVSPYKAIKSGVGFRRYFEGIFGSPVIGSHVSRYGSIKNIPIDKYISGNIQDIFYGAAPGIALMSPFIGFQAGKIAAGKAYQKITGHRPGWANKQTEASIESDFTAGESWTHIKNALEMFSRGRRKAVASGLITAMLATGPTSAALAKDLGAQTARRMTFNVGATATQRIKSARDIIDTALNITHPGASAAAKRGAVIQLKETAWHESMKLKELRQLIWRDGKFVPEGTARGIFGVEPATAQNWMKKVSEKWWHWNKDKTKKVYTSYRYPEKIAAFEKASGLTFNELMALNRSEMGDLLQKNQLFGGVVTIENYETPLEGFVGDRNARAILYQEKHQRGGPDVREKRIKSFKASGSTLDEAQRQSQENMKDAVRNKMKPTAGLTNEVLHDRRINHTIINQAEKTKHLFRGV